MIGIYSVFIRMHFLVANSSTQELHGGILPGNLSIINPGNFNSPFTLPKRKDGTNPVLFVVVVFVVSCDRPIYMYMNKNYDFARAFIDIVNKLFSIL